MTTITEMARGLAMVLADASNAGLPEPISIRLDDRDGVDIHISGGPEELQRWADWADVEIVPDDPRPYRDEWSVHHRCKAEIHELPVRVTAVEFGVMTDAERFDCDHCGARLGTSGGFVAAGTHNDHFEIQVALHQSGDCSRGLVEVAGP